MWLATHTSTAKVYVVQTRCAGRSKRVTVGRHGDVSPDQARKEAARIIARIKAGEARIPVAPKAALTMAELAERYQREHVAMRRRPATVAHYRIMLAKHIVPALGELKVDEVERKHILAFQYELREKPTVANRALDMLIKMFNLAEAWELRPPGKNPCRFVRRYKVQAQHERFLTPEELHRLGCALDAAPAERLASRHGAAAIRLLVCCFSHSLVGSPWELARLFRRRISWDDGVMRAPAGAGAVAYSMNRCCRSGEDVGARAARVGKRWGIPRVGVSGRPARRPVV